MIHRTELDLRCAAHTQRVAQATRHAWIRHEFSARRAPWPRHHLGSLLVQAGGAVMDAGERLRQVRPAPAVDPLA